MFIVDVGVPFYGSHCCIRISYSSGIELNHRLAAAASL